MSELLRPKTSAFMAVSLDGFIARQNGDVDWLDAFHTEQEDYGFHDFIQSVDVIVMGRHTYEKGLTFPQWPYLDQNVIVLSRTLKATQHGVNLHSGGIQPLLQQLHLEQTRHIYIDGGQIISQCLNEKLLDNMTISVIPILLGNGIPLFKDVQAETDCHLVSSKTYPNGIVKLQYDVKMK